MVVTAAGLGCGREGTALVLTPPAGFAGVFVPIGFRGITITIGFRVVTISSSSSLSSVGAGRLAAVVVTILGETFGSEVFVFVPPVTCGRLGAGAGFLAGALVSTTVGFLTGWAGFLATTSFSSSSSSSSLPLIELSVVVTSRGEVFTEGRRLAVLRSPATIVA